jgi:hypothetical protein
MSRSLVEEKSSHGLEGGASAADSNFAARGGKLKEYRKAVADCARSQDVVINLVEVAWEVDSFGNGEVQDTV